MAFGGTDLRSVAGSIDGEGCRRNGRCRRGARSVADRAAVGRQADGAGDSGGGARLSSVVSVALCCGKAELRVLALAAAIDMGGNTPIEFLLENSGIELLTLYVVAGHRIAGAAARSRRRNRDRLAIRRNVAMRCASIERAAAHWPRPLLNPPHLRSQSRPRQAASGCCPESKGWISRRPHR